MAEISVTNVYMPGAVADTLAFERLLDAIEAQGLKIKVPKAGSYILGDASSELSIRCLAPVKDKYSKLNNYSIVLRDMLWKFFGYATGTPKRNRNGKCLKRATCLNPTCLNWDITVPPPPPALPFWTRFPEAAVISVGRDNSTVIRASPCFGHAGRSIEIYRTDEAGGAYLKSSDGVLLHRQCLALKGGCELVYYRPHRRGRRRCRTRGRYAQHTSFRASKGVREGSVLRKGGRRL